MEEEDEEKDEQAEMKSRFSSQQEGKSKHTTGRQPDKCVVCGQYKGRGAGQEVQGGREETGTDDRLQHQSGGDVRNATVKAAA